MAAVALWEMKQQVEDLSPFLYLPSLCHSFTTIYLSFKINKHVRNKPYYNQYQKTWPKKTNSNRKHKGGGSFRVTHTCSTKGSNKDSSRNAHVPDTFLRLKTLSRILQGCHLHRTDTSMRK